MGTDAGGQGVKGAGPEPTAGDLALQRPWSPQSPREAGTRATRARSDHENSLVFPSLIDLSVHMDLGSADGTLEPILVSSLKLGGKSQP